MTTEIMIYVHSVSNTSQILGCGFQYDMKGNLYYHSKDKDSVITWFNTKLKPMGWILNVGGPSNAYDPKYDARGKVFDAVYYIKRHPTSKSINQPLLVENEETPISF